MNSRLSQVVCRLLDPTTPELSATMVGRLVYVLLRKADQAVAPYLEQILRAVLSKMQHSELPAVHQVVLMVRVEFIYLNLKWILEPANGVCTFDSLSLGSSVKVFVIGTSTGW